MATEALQLLEKALNNPVAVHSESLTAPPAAQDTSGRC
jgi:hypothetical protein